MGIIVKLPSVQADEQIRDYVLAQVDTVIQVTEPLMRRCSDANIKLIGQLLGMLRVACDEKMERALEDARRLHILEEAVFTPVSPAQEDTSGEEEAGETPYWPGQCDYFDFLAE